MYRYYFIFRSLMDAQRALRLLRETGIEAILTSAPGLDPHGGCTHAVQVKELWKRTASTALEKAGITPVRVLRVSNNSVLEEAQL